MNYLLVFALMVFYPGLTGAGKVADNPGSRPVFYRRWPACRKGSEYAQVINEDDRVPGERYNERKKHGGVIKTYICMPCTQCASGVRELSTCSIEADTACSETECAVDGCILDPMLTSCRLPGDPNEYSSIGAMMDPCDPTTFTALEPTPLPITSMKAPPPKGMEKSNDTARSRGEQSKDAEKSSLVLQKPPHSGWETNDITLIVVFLFAVGFAIAFLFVFKKYRILKKKRIRETLPGSSRQRESSVTETMV